MSDFTPEQVERAAEALRRAREHFAAIAGSGPIQVWEDTGESRGIDNQVATWAGRGERICAEALAVLSAAGAPERTPEFESREQELFKHQPVLSMSDGGVHGCQCMDRVFYGKIEDWGTHLAEVFDLLSAAGAPEKVAPVVDEAALAEFLESPTHAPMETHSRADGSCSECPWPVHQLPPAEIAAAVAAYLRGESK